LQGASCYDADESISTISGAGDDDCADDSDADEEGGMCHDSGHDEDDDKQNRMDNVLHARMSYIWEARGVMYVDLRYPRCLQGVAGGWIMRCSMPEQDVPDEQA
jgi:hypothetical protein